MAGRLYKPVDPEHIAIAGCKGDTFMGFFEGIAKNLLSYERHLNPASKAEVKSAEKPEDEEFMKKTADYNDPEPDSPKRVRINSFNKDEDGDIGLVQASTSRPRRMSSPNKVKTFKKMTDDVAAYNSGTARSRAGCEQGRYQEGRLH